MADYLDDKYPDKAVIPTGTRQCLKICLVYKCEYG